MKILAFDTTAKAASVAVAEDGRVLAAFTFDSGRTHSEILLPMAQSVCARAGFALHEMDYYAVTVGPGSFTGVRIGVATVKGLAFRSPPTAPPRKNCVGISTLEAIAESLMPLDGIYVPVMDAKRGEVYNALFRAEGGKLTRLCPDRAIPLSLLAESLRKEFPGVPVRLCGDGYEVAYRALAQEGLLLSETPLLLRTQNAASVALCAFRHLADGEAVEDTALSPVYLRLPQAERERLARLKEQDHNIGKDENI